MPYTGPGDDKLPDNIKELPETKRGQWVAVFNSSLERCAAQQSPGDDCEAVAFRAANGVVFKEMALFTPPVNTGLSGLLSAAQVRELGLWTARLENKLQGSQGELTMQENDEMYMPMGPTTFADMRVAEQADEAAEHIHRLTYQFQSLVANVMASESTTDKMAAIEALSGEFLTLAREALTGGAMEEGAPDDSPSVELSESALGYALALAENDNGVNRRAPLDLDVVIIRPGFGNKRDRHFYGREMLEKYAQAFVGAKMYSTDHREDEKSVRTEVSRIKEIVGFEDGAPVGRAKVFDPDFAELVRNRAEAGELNSLECSILANGTARKGEVDGQQAKIVESIKEVRSVDWVTRAGAGGHALRLAESEVDMPEETQEVQEAELEEVTIEEEAQAAEPQEMTTQEAEPVTMLEADVVTAKLAESKLPGTFKAALAVRQYADYAALAEAITQAVKEVKAITGSGQPFAQGASQPVDAVPLSEAEIEEKRKVRYNEIMAQVGLKGV